MRDIPESLRHLPEAKVLEQAQNEFLKASEELLAANRSAMASGKLHDDELELKANSMNAALERVNAAEKDFERVTEVIEGTTVKLSRRVSKMVRRTFAPDQQPEAIRLLEQKCVRLPFIEDTPEALDRTRLAVLKVAAGTLDELRKQIEVTKIDWRDVLNAAEYPEGISMGLSAYDDLDQETRERVDRRDRKQYLDRLGETESNGFFRRIWNKLN